MTTPKKTKIDPSRIVEWVKTSNLKPNPKNRNKHSDEQIDRLAKLISFYGFRVPIIVSTRSQLVVSGHGRLEAAKRLKLETVPVSYQDFKDEDSEYGFGVSDNGIALWAELDLKAINIDIPDLGLMDIDLLGIKDFEIDPTDKYSDKNADDVPNIKKTKIKLGDLFQLGNHRLLCGDATRKEDVERLMNGEKADMLLWDPPWNVNFDYNEYQDSKTVDEYGLFISNCLSNWNDIAKDSFVAVVWQSEKNWIHFHKWFPNNARLIAVMKNFVSRAKHFLQRAFDPALMWTGPDFEYFQVPGHNQRDYFMSNTAATHDNGTGIRESGHPCPRQVDAYEYFITGWSKQKQMIVDLCAGSGTCFIACEKTNRRCFGMEIDPQYCQVIIDRWEKFTGQKHVKL